MRLCAFLVVAVFLLASCGGSQPAEDVDPLASEGDSESGLNAGLKMARDGEIEKAAREFEKILARYPEHPDAHYNLALMQTRLGDLKKAENHYQLALKFDPKHHDARNNLGLLLMDKGDYLRAEGLLKTHLEHHPDDPSANYNYGLVKDTMGKLKEARKYYEKSAELDPSDPTVWIGLASLDIESGDLESAFLTVRRGREAIPTEPTLVIFEAKLLFALKKAAEAIGTLKSLSDISDCPLDYFATAGLLLSQNKKEAAALELYEAAIARDPSYARAHFLAGNVLARKKDFAAAAVHFEAFLKIVPEGETAEKAKQALAACKAQARP